MHIQTLKIDWIPSWLPVIKTGFKPVSTNQAEDARRKIVIRMHAAERRVLRKRAKIPVSDWAERHRFITTGDAIGNRFSKKTFAYAPAIMDASFYKSVREIVLCAADQVGKSFIIDTCIGYAADRDPGPVLFVYPDEDTAKDNMKDRLQPMFRMSPRLRSYLTGSVDDEGQKRINLQHMTIYAAWASSAVKLANRPIKYGCADEVGKFPATAGKTEGSPLDKIRKRFRHYRYNYKLWISSTPTVENNEIWSELNTCDAVFEFRVKCPDCGDVHLMEFETTFRWFRWDDNKDPEKVERDNLGYYVCKNCGAIWDDYKRDEAVRGGHWYSMSKTPDGRKELDGAGMAIENYLAKYNPRKIGFHLPSWISSVVSISSVCAAFMRAAKDKTKLKDFNNSHAAKPWTDFTQVRKEEELLSRLADDRPRGIVPGDGRVCCLTAGVDTQGTNDINGWFRYEIRAWGWGDISGVLPASWQVDGGRAESFEELEKILWKTKYFDPDGNEYFIYMAMQDSMGRRTDDVYSFCARHRGRIFPTQGVDGTRMSTPYKPSDIDFFPNGKKIPGGLKLYRFSNKYFKDILNNKLELDKSNEGAWFFNSETDIAWARELCAEVIDDKTGQWVIINSMPNHALDCSVLNILAAERLRLRSNIKRETGEQIKGRRIRSRGLQRD